MNHIVVIAFDDMHQAGELRTVLKRMQTQGDMRLDDTAVVVKDASGHVEVKDENGHAVAWGTVAGGALGLILLATIPVAGLALGAAAGGAVGVLADKGIKKDFIERVTESLKPGTSALFLLARQANREAVLGALRPYRGTVMDSTLEPEAEETLKKALSEFE